VVSISLSRVKFLFYPYGMNMILVIFVGLLLLKLSVELGLDRLNYNHVRNAAGPVPEAFSEFIDQETYDKSISYTLAKNRFGVVDTLFEAALLAAIMLSGLLPWLYGGIEDVLGRALWAQALNLFAIVVLLDIPSLPLEWWAKFRLEERFGFNKSTIKLWITDKIKGFFVSLLLGFPLLCLLLWLVELPLWWLWAFLVFFGFQALMLIIYPQFIMPLFNKFEPLKEGDLRRRLMALADRTGFRARTILVMDGSKRTGHSNAFFTGFGKFRRIVLYDTLMEQLEPEELEAVLAHEIGHYKLGHILKMMALSAIFILLGFRILAWLMNHSWFYTGFGFSADSGLAPALLLIGLLAGLVTFWLNPLVNHWMRHHEYEADAFARESMKDGRQLISSLRKLHEKNLSNLTPHPAFSRFYYSHPTLLERENALRRPLN